nr:hypothetical protein MACL_00003602 [Theileria orientalis]
MERSFKENRITDYRTENENPKRPQLVSSEYSSLSMKKTSYPALHPKFLQPNPPISCYYVPSVNGLENP